MCSQINYNSILIVDDNPTNLEVLSETLVTSGFQVAVALDGETALKQIKYHQPELIILDVMMPGIDGFETCKRLKANPLTSEVPIIFATALSDTANKVTGLSLGAVDYITKPFQCEEVLARIKIHLKLRNLDRTLEKQNQLLKQEIVQRKTAENLLQKLNQELERRVQNRTYELSKALQKLEQAQVQLIHNEKMSSLGRLVAGVAHELNNPVNFIHGNLNPASEYIKDLLTLVELCQQDIHKLPPAIQDYFEQVDFQFIKDDLPKILSSIKIGTQRIRNLVVSLRNFSRLDQAEKKPVDIHEGIESTLLILQKQLKGKPNDPSIQIIKKYGELPKIECYPSQLNQVFMNLLSNAIDALDEQNRQPSPGNKIETPTIWIMTERSHEDSVTISIKDNGLGIPKHLQAKIFDPFFTTKAVGKGTGLGLSISYQIIVETHSGELLCHSELGKGTEFVIKIPSCIEENKSENDF
jgi:two-component system NtrC family sensor kinase